MISIAVSTLGCPKNIVDSENMMGRLKLDGFHITDQPDEADVVVLNTCGFISQAVEESVNVILDYIEFKKEKKIILAVVGCLVERYKDELADKIKDVDIWLGIAEMNNIGDKIKTFFPQTKFVSKYKGKQWDTKLTPSHFAYIKVADGCSNRCSFCVIPSIKGNYKSRDMGDIVDDVSKCVLNGVKEICLVAQDVSGYGHDLNPSLSLVGLLKRLETIDGLKWIRLMYMYPDKITDYLLDYMALSKKICRYMDVPFQHFSTNILKSMRRKETEQSIYELVNKIRKKIPGIFLRTSLIVGYPGETREDFQKLLDGMDKLKFERLGAFIYSDEEGTAAMELPDKVSDDTAYSRYDKVMKLQQKISLNINRKLKNKTLPVMIDHIENDGIYIGRTQFDAPQIDNSVIITSSGGNNYLPGDFVNVCITSAGEYDIEGMIKQ
ncbi:30S ribosomal protein S12 methylthiotransferase RimO [bacterium]|nr:30S ribosomal protein S12 methylthiotransferase RimO [bacterium]